jgi:hypothetical protein
MKQKIQTTKAASFLSDDVSEITDEPLQSSSTISQQESTQAQSRWKSDKQITKTEESLLDDLEARSQQMMVLNQQVLERIKPSVDKERDAFVDWLRSVINDLDHDVWRCCQQQISNTLYKYIAENDRLKRQQTLPATNPPNPSMSKQSNTSLQGSSRTCSPIWQPPPSQWLNQPSSSVSVWQSQDGNWINQQFPHQQQSFTQLQPIRLSSSRQVNASPLHFVQGNNSRKTESTFSVDQIFNTSDPEVPELE